MNEQQTIIKGYLSKIGKAGGKAGKGRAKARTSNQARKAARARWKNNHTGKANTKAAGTGKLVLVHGN